MGSRFTLSLDEIQKQREKVEKAQQTKAYNGGYNTAPTDTLPVLKTKKKTTSGGGMSAQNLTATNKLTEGVADFMALSRPPLPKRIEDAPVVTKGNVETSKFEKWVNPDYKLSKEEEKQAKEYIKKYRKGTAQDVAKRIGKGTVTAEEKDRFNKVNVLDAKLSGGAAAYAGFTDAFPLSNLVAGKVASNYPEAKEVYDETQEVLNASQMQNPVASLAGRAGGEIGKYAVGSQVAQTIPGLNTATQGVGKGVAGAVNKMTGGKIGGDLLAGAVANIAGDTVVDVALDTIPNAVVNANSGMSAGEVATEAAKNIGTNLMWNIGSEGAMQAGKKGIEYLKNLRKSKPVTDIAGEVAEQGVKPLENVAESTTTIKSTIPQLEEAKNSIQKSYSDLNIKPETKTVADQKMNELSSLIDDLNNATDRDAILDITMKIESKAMEVDELLNGNAVLTTKMDNGSKEQFDNFKNAMSGKKIKLDNMNNSELNVESLKEANNSIYTGYGSGKFARNSGTPLDEVFDEIDESVGRELSSYMKKNGMDPENPSDQYRGLVEYAQSVKHKNSVTDYDMPYEKGTVFNDEFYDNVLNGGNAKVQQMGTDKYKVVAEDMGIKPQSESITMEIPYDEVRHVDNSNIPEGQKVSKFRDNTMEYSGIESVDELEKRYVRDMYTYAPKTEKQTLEVASERMKDSDTWLSNYIGGKSQINSAEDVDTCMMLWQNLKTKRAQAIAEGNTQLADEYMGKIQSLTKRLQEVSTEKGQAIEALAKWSRTSDGALLQADKMLSSQTDDWIKANPRKAEKIEKTGEDILNRVHDELGSDDLWNSLTDASKKDEYRSQIEDIIRHEAQKRNVKINDDVVRKISTDVMEGAHLQDIAETLERFEATGSYGVSGETIDKVTDIFTEAEKYDFNSKQRVELETEAFRLLANDIYKSPGSWGERFEQWRYLAMLGNPKTHIRNLIGNKLFSTMTGISNNVAAVMEGMVGKVSKGAKRTKAVLNPISDSNLIKASSNDATSKFYRQLKGNKYNDSVGKAIEDQRKVFKTKTLQGLSNLNAKALDAEDFMAMKKKYSTSLAGYLKANGVDESIFKAEDSLNALRDKSTNTLLSNAEKAEKANLEKQVEILTNGREYALKQAEYSAFHEENAVAECITKFSNYLKNSDSGSANFVGKVVEGILPFKKTPANILKSGIEYSPISLVKSVTADAYKLAKGTMDVPQYIENLSKGLTGSGIMALGAYMYNQGILSSSADAETGKFDSLQGKQPYSIVVGDKTFTIDFAVPSVMPLLVGAEVAKLWDEASEENTTEGFWETLNNMDIDNVINSAMNIVSPVMETSMLSGLNDTLDALQYSEQSPLPTLAANALTSYYSQGIPTVLGQIARTTDNTRRSTYTDSTGAMGQIERQIQKIENKIPGLSQNNEPYIDMWGREQQNINSDNPLAKVGYQFASPSYMADINTTETDANLQALYNVTKNPAVLPTTPESTIKGVKLTPEQYTQFSKSKGQTSKDLIDMAFADSNFQNLNDDDKANVIKEIYSLSSKIGAQETLADYEDSSAILQIYNEQGAQKAIDDMITEKIIESTGVNANKTSKEIYATEGMEGLQQFAEFSGAKEKLNITSGSEVYETVYRAKGEEGLKFADALIKEAGGTSTSKILPVLQLQNMSAEEKGEYIQLFNKDIAKGATKAKNAYGDIGVYEYYNIKMSADADGNGSASKGEIVKYLGGRKNMTDDVKNAYIKFFFPDSKKKYF